jgi:hypothetical protein
MLSEFAKILFKLLEDPWCWSGIPKSKELISVVELLDELGEIIA